MDYRFCLMQTSVTRIYDACPADCDDCNCGCNCGCGCNCNCCEQEQSSGVTDTCACADSMAALLNFSK